MLRNKVKRLREKGKTYPEIQKALSVKIPKSTLSNWCNGLLLPSNYKKKIKKLNTIHLNKVRKKALEKNKKIRESFLEEIKARNLFLADKLDKDILKIALAMLYLGEGSKWKSHRGLMLGNSDPNIIRLYLGLLKDCYFINIDSLRCRVLYRADQDINKLQRFWSRITKIPIKHFYKTVPDSRTKGKKTKKKDYMGVCVVSGGSTEIQQELQIISDLILGVVAQR